MYELPVQRNKMEGNGSNALNLLAQYNTDSDNEDEGVVNPKKRKSEGDNHNKQTKIARR